MSDIERADYDNLILLCVQHHDETDDVKKYPVKTLKKMKKLHTSKYLRERTNSNPSMLNNVINAIANMDIKGSTEYESIDAFDIKSKINYNNVKRYAPLIQDYKVYHHKINLLYDELERQGSLKKNKILQTIRSCYLRTKGNYVNSRTGKMEQIKKHADDIIDDVFDELCSKVEGSDIFAEDVTLGIELIMVDAFMRCKILEEPK